MQRRRITSALFVLSLASSVAVAQSSGSIAGTWNLNLARSHLGGMTYTVSQTASGAMHIEGQGYAYDFDLSGKQFPTPGGGTIAVTAPSANVLDMTMRTDGKVTGNSHATLYGDSAVWISTTMKSDGSSVEQPETDKRTSGGPGWLGTWKSGDASGGAQKTYVITLDGADGITLASPVSQFACKAQFDGKDYTLTQAGAPTTVTQAFTRNGATAFTVVTKIDGTPYYTEAYSLSADGSTLTDQAIAASNGAKVTAVYERQ